MTTNSPSGCRMLLVALWSLSAVAPMGGCGERKKMSDEIIPLEGKVEKVDARPDGTGKLTVAYRDKRDQPLQGTAEVTKETDIMINGAAAPLSDIRPGDRIRGEVRMLKKDRDRKLTILKIAIDRPDAKKEPSSP